jgi:aldehyde:ferredoxin oxidoreductase
MFLEAAERDLVKVNLNELGFLAKNNSQEKNKYEIWGSVSGVDNLISLIVHREAIGNDLAEGVRNFCKKYNLPRDMITHGKGLEVPAHEPRANNLTALDFATSSRGAYHAYEPAALSSNMNLKKELGLTKRIKRFTTGKIVADAVKKIQDSSEAYSACGGCIFGFHWILEIAPWVNALNAITGKEYTVKTWLACGERIFNTKRAYNLKCGITKEDDTIGDRFFNPIEKGGTRKNVPPLNELVPLYYKLRGWDDEGNPAKNNIDKN